MSYVCTYVQSVTCNIKEKVGYSVWELLPYSVQE